MKELVTNIWCDSHLRREERQPGTEYTVDLGKGPRRLDLCDPCAKEVVQPLRDLLEEDGQPMMTKPKKKHGAGFLQDKDGNWLCPECGMASKSAGGLGAHRRTHGITGSSPSTAVYHRLNSGK